MKKIKRFAALIPALVLWLMFSVLLWGFVFTRITDTSPRCKLTLCVDAQVPGDTELALRLEENAGEGIRMVKVRPFSYAMFDGAELTGADLFIVPASHVETYRAWFRPLPEEFWNEKDLMILDGTPLGVQIFWAETGRGAAQDCISYRNEDGGAEDFYLLFGAESLHVAGNENAVDSEALSAARLLMDMR